MRTTSAVTRTTFAVTYEIVTPESAEDGEVEERGFIADSCSLRDALRWVQETRTNHVGGIEAIEPSDSRADEARWITVYNSAEYLTGARENRSIHFPDHVTGTTRKRLLRCIERGVGS